MKNLIYLPLICLVVSVYQSSGHARVGTKNKVDITPFFKVLEGAELYMGFGLARDLINHVYFGKDFAPRDYDLAVVGSTWTKEEAIETLQKYGKVMKVLDVSKEVVKPNGNVFLYQHGFVVIIDHKGVQVDFKFFKNLPDAHQRGFYNVEKVLIPFDGRSIEQVLDDFLMIREQGRLPNKMEVSDPFGGISSILDKNPITSEPAKAKARKIDWIIRGAMIFAKMGVKKFPQDEIEIMKQYIRDVQYIMPFERGLFPRAYNHPSWWHVKELLESVGFFESFPKWKWREPVNEYVLRMQRESLVAPHCSRLF